MSDSDENFSMTSFNIMLQVKGDLDKYPAKTHARRVAQRLGLRRGLIALEGTKTAYYSNSDQKQPFRQDRYFYYLTGCNEPDCYITYNIQSDNLILHLPSIDYRRFFYDGRGSTVEEALEKYDIDGAVYLDKSAPIAPVNVRRVDDFSYLCEDRRDFWTLKSVALLGALDYCRSVKDEHEIQLIRKANKITALAFKDVLQRLHFLNNEAEAEALYIRGCMHRFAKEQAYGPIFGAGVNASTLHYIKNDAPFEQSQLLLVDAGCEWQHYGSDVTRTIPLKKQNPGSWPSNEAQQLYEVVEAIQEECIRMMRPGIKYSTIAARADHLAIDALRKLGVLRGRHDAIWAAGTSRAFFPHGLGHHVGLEVHDNWPRNPLSNLAVSSPQNMRPGQQQEQKFSFMQVPSDLLDGPAVYDTSTELDMEPGNVITIEPGLYFNREFLEMFVLPLPKHRLFIDIDALRRFIPLGGVRIEDDILITKQGYKNLTLAPKGREMLEILRTSVTAISP